MCTCFCLCCISFLSRLFICYDRSSVIISVFFYFYGQIFVSICCNRHCQRICDTWWTGDLKCFERIISSGCRSDTPYIGITAKGINRSFCICSTIDSHAVYCIQPGCIFESEIDIVCPETIMYTFFYLRWCVFRCILCLCCHNRCHHHRQHEQQWQEQRCYFFPGLFHMLLLFIVANTCSFYITCVSCT